jgi:hypothetical protein
MLARRARRERRPRRARRSGGGGAAPPGAHHGLLSDRCGLLVGVAVEHLLQRGVVIVRVHGAGFKRRSRRGTGGEGADRRVCATVNRWVDSAPPASARGQEEAPPAGGRRRPAAGWGGVPGGGPGQAGGRQRPMWQRGHAGGAERTAAVGGHSGGVQAAGAASLVLRRPGASAKRPWTAAVPSAPVFRRHGAGATRRGRRRGAASGGVGWGWGRGHGRGQGGAWPRGGGGARGRASGLRGAPPPPRRPAAPSRVPFVAALILKGLGAFSAGPNHPRRPRTCSTPPLPRNPAPQGLPPRGATAAFGR